MNNIKEILEDIENGKLTVDQIVEKHNITKYKYNQILKTAEIKKPYAHASNEKTAKTDFQRMLKESEAKTDNSSFDLEGFKADCKGGMKISELMEKYGLSLYQIRELRKKYELKTK